MGDHRDAEISEIVVVLHSGCLNNVDLAIEKLKSAGMDVYRTDSDNNVVEGAVDATKLADLHKLDCVDYVRTVMTYIADFPPGDPRDKDGPEDDSD